MPCPHHLIQDSLDRWSETHWYIHQMEQYFHEPDLFRYSCNSFIRSIKEIPQILHMELQNQAGYHSLYKPLIDELKSNTLLVLLSKKRDFIVHQGALDFESFGYIGKTRGQDFKMGMKFPVATHETSDEAYERFKQVCKREKIIRDLFGPDEDTLPCIERSWRISELPEEDLLDVCINAWKLAGEILSNFVMSFGGSPLNLSPSCLHSSKRVRMKLYSTEEFFREVDGKVLGE